MYGLKYSSKKKLYRSDYIVVSQREVDLASTRDTLAALH